MVDDHDTSRDHTLAVLRGGSCTVRHAASAGVALEMALSWLPGLIVTDYHLPDHDGVSLVRMIRRRWPNKHSHPRVILLTGDHCVSGIRGLEALNARHVLIKPVSGGRLLRAAGLCPEPGNGEPGKSVHKREMAWLFRSELERRLPQLDRCLSDLDHDQAARILHQFIAASAINEEQRLTASLRALEASCKRHDAPVVLAGKYHLMLEQARDFLFRVTADP